MHRHVKNLFEYALWFGGFFVIALALVVDWSALEKALTVIIGIILLVMGWS